MVQKLSTTITEKMQDPVKKSIKLQEADLRQEIKRLETKMLKLGNENQIEMESIKEELRSKLERDVSIIVNKMARSTSDNDVKHNKAADRLCTIEAKQGDQTSHFEELATAIS